MSALGGPLSAMPATPPSAPDCCPRCGAHFACGATGSAPCACTKLTLSTALQTQLRQQYTGCLCLACLQALAATLATADPAGGPLA